MYICMDIYNITRFQFFPSLFFLLSAFTRAFCLFDEIHFFLKLIFRKSCKNNRYLFIFLDGYEFCKQDALNWKRLSPSLSFSFSLFITPIFHFHRFVRIYWATENFWLKLKFFTNKSVTLERERELHVLVVNVTPPYVKPNYWSCSYWSNTIEWNLNISEISCASFYLMWGDKTIR